MSVSSAIEWGRSRPAREWREDLRPLLSHLARYDALRRKLEDEGGTSYDLMLAAEFLEAKIPAPAAGRGATVSLADPDGVQRFLNDVSWSVLRFQVRRDITGLPLYYVARLGEDYWSYRLVVEDLYRSPGFPADDERFVQMMSYSGHEEHYLRLSGLREPAIRLAGGEEGADRLLLKAGRHVLAAAWHSDQRISAAIARQLEAPEILHAVELLYLVLSGDLSSVRDEIAGDSLACRFFEVVYPQPYIRNLLGQLPDLKGSRLAELPKQALQLYGTLTAEFNRFLRTPVEWGPAGQSVPLYKLVLAHWRRLHLVAPVVKPRSSIRRATQQLAQASASVEAQLLQRRS